MTTSLTIPLLTICAISNDGQHSFLKSFRDILDTPGVPARTGYWLAKMHKVFTAESEAFNMARNRLLVDHGTTSEENPGNFAFTPENAVKFQQEIASLDHPVELGVPAELKLDLPANFTPSDWLPLMDAVDLFNEPK